MSATYYAVLRVRVKPDGQLQPLWYSVASRDDWSSQTVVNNEYSIALCVLVAKTAEAACVEFKRELAWWAPLLGDAQPEPWFVETAGSDDGSQ